MLQAVWQFGLPAKLNLLRQAVGGNIPHRLLAVWRRVAWGLGGGKANSLPETQNGVKHINIFARLRLLFTTKLALSPDERLSRHAHNWACLKAFRQRHASACCGA